VVGGDVRGEETKDLFARERIDYSSSGPSDRAAVLPLRASAIYVFVRPLCKHQITICSSEFNVVLMFLVSYSCFIFLLSFYIPFGTVSLL
jgi:hypothetical protein